MAHAPLIVFIFLSLPLEVVGSHMGYQREVIISKALIFYYNEPD